jgi:hypothetical protein
MRLIQQQVDTIVSLTLRRLPDVLAIRVYGSRLDDKRRGGDVDLIIETAERVDWPWMDASSNAKRRTSSCSAHSPRSMSDTPNRRTVNTENDRNDRAIHRLLP